MFKQKKLLSLFLSALIILSIMPFSNVAVFAETATEITLTLEEDFSETTTEPEDIDGSTKSVFNFNVGDAWIGEEIIITLSAKNMIGLESANLEFAYDEEYFEFIKITKGSGIDWGKGGKPSDTQNKLTFGFFFPEYATSDMDICTITLKVLKAGTSEITVKCKSWEGEPQTPDDATVKITAVTRPETEDEETSTPEEDSTLAEEDTTIPEKPSTDNNSKDAINCEICGKTHRLVIEKVFCAITNFFLTLFRALGYWD